MESLNMYASDGESDSSSSMVVRRKSTANSEEVDANCELITMDMSEDSSNGHSDNGTNEQRDTNKRRYSKSLSTSPATSYSSDSSDSNKRSRGREEDPKIDASKSKRYDQDKRNDDRRSKYNRDYRHDDDRDRRRRDDKRDRHRDRDSDRYSAKKSERKRHRSRSRSSSHSRRNSRSYRHKNKSRSRSRSHDRYQRKSSPNRNNSRRKSPYRSRRSKSRTRSRSPRDKPRPKNWKSTSKLKVLEKLGIELKVPPVVVEPPPTGINQTVTNPIPTSQLTPQMLLQKTMEEQVEKVKTATGITLPSYYNPMAVNPTKYAEQIQKRRLLWGNKDKPANNPPPEEKKEVLAETKGTGTIWQGATFGGDQDGKMTAKFQRLMGIKNPVAAAVPETKKDGADLIKKQEEMFNSMESQYEVARLATHTHRGVGLGFGTFQPR